MQFIMILDLWIFGSDFDRRFSSRIADNIKMDKKNVTFSKEKRFFIPLYKNVVLISQPINNLRKN